MKSSALSLLFRCALIALIGFFGTMGIFAKRGFLDWQRITEQNRKMAAKVQGARRQKEAMERRIEALQSRSSEQERLVRQVLGYVRSYETVIEF